MNNVYRIIIDARIEDGENPGVQSFIEGIAQGLLHTEDSRFEIHWLSTKNSKWLEKILPKDHRLHYFLPQQGFTNGSYLSERIPDSRFQYASRYSQLDARIPIEPRELIKLEPDLVMFCSQDAFMTRYPSIYHPHDLQHYFLSEYFEYDTLGWRHLAWARFAGAAAKVVCGSNHVAKDVNFLWNIPNANIEVIQPATTFIQGHTNRHDSFSLSNLFTYRQKCDFFIYPAQFYKHKNHVTLLKAFRKLIDEGIEISLILTGGSLTDFKKFIWQHVVALSLESHVQVLGFIDRPHLIERMKASIGIVVPSLYESKSFPVSEAMSLGIPVIASNISGIDEQLQSFPYLLFDPIRVDSIVERMKYLIELSAESRQELSSRLIKDYGAYNCIEMTKLYYQLWETVVRSRNVG